MKNRKLQPFIIATIYSVITLIGLGFVVPCVAWGDAEKWPQLWLLLIQIVGPLAVMVSLGGLLFGHLRDSGINRVLSAFLFAISLDIVYLISLGFVGNRNPLIWDRAEIPTLLMLLSIFGIAFFIIYLGALRDYP